MSNFFLLNNAISVTPFQIFMQGMIKLVAIEKQVDHIFIRSSNIWHVPILLELYSNYGQTEQNIVRFIEQLSPTESNIDTEEKANTFCNSAVNGFLGIDFSSTPIPKPKQIIDDPAYKTWCNSHKSNFDKLKDILGSTVYNKNFVNNFSGFSSDVQISIIEEFKKAKRRKLMTPFFPDTKIIKDVTSNNHNVKVMELRVYHPMAIRVYFNESAEVVYLASIEQKSNPNQNDDIQKAYKILISLIK
jgi:hypothetical protein